MAILSGCSWMVFPAMSVSTAFGGETRRAGLPLPSTAAMAQAGHSSGLVSKIPRGVRERRRQDPDRINPEKEARMLTSRITKTDSAVELLELLGEQVQDKIFNEYHISASMTKLARLKKNRPFRQAEAK